MIYGQTIREQSDFNISGYYERVATDYKLLYESSADISILTEGVTDIFNKLIEFIKGVIKKITDFFANFFGKKAKEGEEKPIKLDWNNLPDNLELITNTDVGPQKHYITEIKFTGLEDLSLQKIVNNNELGKKLSVLTYFDKVIVGQRNGGSESYKEAVDEFKESSKEISEEITSTIDKALEDLQKELFGEESTYILKASVAKSARLVIDTGKQKIFSKLKKELNSYLEMIKKIQTSVEKKNNMYGSKIEPLGSVASYIAKSVTALEKLQLKAPAMFDKLVQSARIIEKIVNMVISEKNKNNGFSNESYIDFDTYIAENL